MKLIRYVLIIFLCSSSMLFGQYISVDDTQSAQALVDILMDDVCGVQVTNPKLVTGTDFNINGIGVFSEDTGNFPLKKGVLITSGRASDCIGPKKEDPMLAGDGTDWKGDKDLENNITWVDKTFDASYLEFNFSTFSTSIRFNYVFASEEYGQIQCRRSDPFAFLLTDTETNTTINLALVPNSSIDVSTMSINNDKFSLDPECESANPEYFDRFFESLISLGLGEDPANSPTNFGGYTKKLTASYNKLIPNRQYKLKLVIADNADLFDGDKQIQLDSGVFIEAGSFDFGIDIEDVKITSGNAVCLGEEVTITTGLPETITHIWYKDNQEIVGETKPNLVVTEPGIYKVKLNLEEDCFVEDSVTVEFKPTGQVKAVKDITYCKSTFDLTLNTALALGNQPVDAFIVRYFETEANANAGTQAIATLKNYTGTNGQTVYVRVESKTNTECFEVTPFKLFIKEPDASFIMKANCDGAIVTVEPKISGGTYSFSVNPQDNAQLDAKTGTLTNATPGKTYTIQYNVVGECLDNSIYNVTIFDKPVITRPTPLEVCDNSPVDGFSKFDLTSKNEEIIGDKTTYTVSYHKTEADASTGNNPLASPYVNDTKTEQTIYACVTDTQTECAVITSLVLKVFKDESGVLELQPSCKGALVVNKFPDGGTFSFNPLPNDGAQINAITGEVTNAITGTSYTITYLVKGDCETVVTKTITIPNGPKINTPQNEMLACDGLDNDGEAVFDLTTVIPEIVGANTKLSVTFYETEDDAKTGENDIKSPENYSANNTQTIYVQAKEGEDCVSVTQFMIKVVAGPSIGKPVTLGACDINDNGKSLFDLTKNEVNINNQPDITFSYYTSFSDAENAVNAIKNPKQFNNTTNPQDIYVRVSDGAITDGVELGCFNITSFSVKVEALPDLDGAISDYNACSETASFEFDLKLKTKEILGDDDAKNDYQLSYYGSQQDADNAINKLPELYTNQTNPETVFVRLESKTFKCANTAYSFKLIVNKKPLIKNKTPLFIEECDDTIELDKNATNDTTVFNLTNVEAKVLEGLEPQKHAVSYYLTSKDAETGTNAITNPTAFQNTINPQTIYVRLDNTDNTDNLKACYDMTTVTLKVKPLPPVDIDTDYVICINEDGTLNTSKVTSIDTGLDESKYLFKWTNAQGDVVSKESRFEPQQIGNYTVSVKDKQTNCEVSVSTTVQSSAPPTISAKVLGDVTATGQSVAVTATGIGSSALYEFSLDGGMWKSNNPNNNTYTFKTVKAGVHVIAARSIYGCGSSQVTVKVIGYPPFFTPNNDGVNDTWQIIGLEKIPQNKVYIFNRYGKLVSEASLLSNGWDGRFKGQLLPATDYWFLVEYYDKQSQSMKQFKGHFALRL